jgi:Raf kinase inhibitor-like YbhB/YbcL family protein
MLERLPAVVGRALRRVRPGVDRFVCRSSIVRSALPVIAVTSPAFGDQQPIPARYTADGEGISPPIAWGDVPEGTRSIALLVEDADSPTPSPLVHAIAWHIDPALRQLAEGDLAPGDHRLSLGINSFLRQGWLPPDPPPGHGPHRYGVQLFALDHDPELGVTPGRSTLIRALGGHTLAYGLLIGTYER